MAIHNPEWRVINALNGKLYGAHSSEAAAFTQQSGLSNIAIVQMRDNVDDPWQMVEATVKQGLSPNRIEAGQDRWR